MIVLFCLVVLLAVPAPVDQLIAPGPQPGVRLLRARRGAPTPAVPSAPAVAACLEETPEDDPGGPGAARPGAPAAVPVPASRTGRGDPSSPPPTSLLYALHRLLQ